MRKKKVLITGATGFLGSHIAKAFLDAKWQVAAGRRSTSNPWRLNTLISDQSNLNFYALEMCDYENMCFALEQIQPEVVINSAAYGIDPSQKNIDFSYDVNTHGSCQLLRASYQVGVQRFIQIGSCFEYGDKNHLISEGDALNPLGIYGATKAAASLLTRQISSDYGLDLCVVRPFGLWGPLESHYRLVPQIIESCLEKRHLSLTGCKQIRDYSYVKDMASWIVSIALAPTFPVGEIINLSSGTSVTLKDFVNNIAIELNGLHLMGFGKLDYRQTEMWALAANNSKQRKLLGELTPTSLRDGLREMIQYIHPNQGVDTPLSQ